MGKTTIFLHQIHKKSGSFFFEVGKVVLLNIEILLKMYFFATLPYCMLNRSFLVIFIFKKKHFENLIIHLISLWVAVKIQA